VDVKRLKRDLWLELQSCFEESTEKEQCDEQDTDVDADDNEVQVDEGQVDPVPLLPNDELASGSSSLFDL
jgi:hypothetical protein